MNHDASSTHSVSFYYKSSCSIEVKEYIVETKRSGVKKNEGYTERKNREHVELEGKGGGGAAKSCILDSSINMPCASRTVGWFAELCKTLTKGF